MVTITVDGKDHRVDENKNLVDSLKEVDIEVPYFCYHPELSVVGMCRICLIEIEGNPKLQPACNMAIQEGMKIRVASEKAIKAREGVMEFLLINHPLDCPVCDKSGECSLQDYSFTVGGASTRYEEIKRNVPQESIGSNLLINHNRCILCHRCVRFDQEIVGRHDLEFIERGSDTLIGYAPVNENETELDHNYQGALADLCPVGALLNKNMLFTSRVWWFEEKQSICHGCSTLCRITTNVKKNELYRYMPPEEPEKNGYFICDQGRFSASEFSRNRLFHYILRSKKSISKEVLAKINERLNNARSILFLGGTTESIEEVESILEIQTKLQSEQKRVDWEYRTTDHMWKNQWQEQIDFLLMKDQRPNSNTFVEKNMGAFESKEKMIQQMKKTDIIFIFNEFSFPYVCLSNDLDGLKNSLLYRTLDKNDLWSKVVLFSTHKNETSQKAFAIVPIQAFPEKSASFRDKKGVVKESTRCIMPPKGLLDTADTLKRIFDFPQETQEVQETKEQMEQSRKELTLKF